MSSDSESRDETRQQRRRIDGRDCIKVVVTAIPPKPLHAIEKMLAAQALQGAGVVKGWVNERLVMAEFWVPVATLEEAIEAVHRHIRNILDGSELLLAAGALEGPADISFQTPGWPKNPPALSVLRDEGTLPVCSLEPWLVML